MKKFILTLILAGWASLAGATALNIPYQNEQPGGTIKSGDWNADMQAIAQWANNNNIDGSTNIATAGVTTSAIANGAVTNSKIDSVNGIYTYGDVYGSSLIQLGNINSSAGEVPTANLGTGTANSTTFLNGNQNWVFPVFGNSNVSAILGSWQTKSGTGATWGPFQASTDGVFYCLGTATVSGDLVESITDSNTNPTTIRCENVSTNGTYFGGCSSVVKKNDYYKCFDGTAITAMYFIPLGS
jgi:hypothetical protein